jgi:hypothetical protein
MGKSGKVMIFLSRSLKSKKKRMSALFVILACGVIIAFLYSRIFLKGDFTMPSDFEQDSLVNSDLIPEMQPLKEKYMIHIFSVPEPNSVGTNDINDAITLIQFKTDGLNYKEIHRSFIEQVSGGDLCFMPLFSKEIIGYSQTRRFVLFNIKTGAFTKYSIGKTLDDLIVNVLPLDTLKKLFLFEIRTFKNENDMMRLRILKIFDLSNPEQIELASLTTGEIGIDNEPWSLQGKTVFIYNGVSRTLQAYDMNFKPVSHSLTTIFNENRKKFRSVDQLYLHPTLPFALLVDIAFDDRKDYMMWILRWDERSPEIFPILGITEKTYCNQFEFSPDGSWLLYRDEAGNTSNPSFNAFPVDSTLSAFLKKPKKLGRLPRKNSTAFTSAWISDPLGFVVTDGEILYRWELSKLKK